jgi:soluble P-type ATPase
VIEIEIPGRGDLRLAHLVVDLNGTLALDGRLIDGVPQRLTALRQQLDVHVLTADTFGVGSQLEGELGSQTERIRTGADKTAFVERWGADSVAAVGNGTVDAGMLSTAALGIAVLGREGLAREAMCSADIIVPDIHTALDLLLNTKRIVATLRR